MDKRERQVTMLGRTLEGQIEHFLRNEGYSDEEEIGYLKEACLLNLLANTILYRTMLEKKVGKLAKENVNNRIHQRIAHLQEELANSVVYQAKLHDARRKESQ